MVTITSETTDNNEEINVDVEFNGELIVIGAEIAAGVAEFIKAVNENSDVEEEFTINSFVSLYKLLESEKES